MFNTVELKKLVLQYKAARDLVTDMWTLAKANGVDPSQDNDIKNASAEYRASAIDVANYLIESGLLEDM